MIQINNFYAAGFPMTERESREVISSKKVAFF